MIEYKGKQYKTREVYVDKNRGTVTIAELALSEALGPIPDKIGKKLDEGIAYYANEEEYAMPEQELRDMIYGAPKPKKR